MLGGAGLQASQRDNWAQVWLTEHNAARTAFGSAPLRWSDALEREAHIWAVRLAREGRMRHAPVSERRGHGENLWMGTSGYFTPEQMIASFVDEQRHFTPGRFPRVSRTGRWSDVGHYTQIVWPETREVGCAVARGLSHDVLVCRYWPSGNVIGTFIAPADRVASR